MRPPVLLALAALGGACTPYQNVSGDYYIGPIDPSKFPAAYVGQGFDPAGSFGTIAPVPAAAVGGAPIAYYSFPVPSGVDPTTLRAQAVGSADVQDRAPFYVFDGDDAKDTSKCTPPSPDYVFDSQRDFVRFDRQGNVVQEAQNDRDPAALPSDAGYVPVYAEVAVTSGGEGCQTVHSAEGLMENAKLTVTPLPTEGRPAPIGKPDGKYLAAAVIDPAAQVFNPDGSLDPVTTLGPQRFGWYNHYLVAYIEGGYFPTMPVTIPGMMGMPDVQAVTALPAILYAPNAFPGAGGNPAACDPANPLDPNAPCVGNGFDLIAGVGGNDGTRGQQGYSPLCSVRTYTPADPTAPLTDPALVDPATVDPDAGAFIYCFQVAQ